MTTRTRVCKVLQLMSRDASGVLTPLELGTVATTKRALTLLKNNSDLVKPGMEVVLVNVVATYQMKPVEAVEIREV